MAPSLISDWVRDLTMTSSSSLTSSFHPCDPSTFLQLAIGLCLHTNPILLRGTSPARRSFLLATCFFHLVFPFGDLGFLACDLRVVVRPFVRVPDARVGVRARRCPFGTA